MSKKVKTTVLIDASPSEVWKYLTTPGLMQKWMGEPEMNIEVITDWTVGNSILINGFHHVEFENKGTILQFNFQKIIQYTHLSTISRLPDTKENYSIVTILIAPAEKGTGIGIQVENFPTESIYKHLDFYWQGTANILKHLIEQEENKNVT